MNIQSDEEALAEAIQEFVDDKFTSLLIRYIADIRHNAYADGYAAGQADEAQARDYQKWDEEYKKACK
jgi:hypothetical protein